MLISASRAADSGSIPIRAGMVHFATFPESLSNVQNFQRTMAAAMDVGDWDVLELSTDMPLAWDAIARGMAQQRGVDLFLTAGNEIVRWPFGLNSAAPRSRKQAVDRVFKLIDRTLAIGAGNLQLMSGAAAFSGNRFEYLLESLNRVGEYVAKAGDPYLTVSFETCSTTELHRQYLGSTPLALWFVDKLAKEQYPCFRITFDLAHLVEIGEDPAASLEIAGDRALHLHLSSCVLAPGDPRSGDLHLPLDTPGAHPTMAETSRALQRWKARIVTAGPQEVPVISTEVRSQPGQDSAETHRHCRRMMARFSKQVGMHRVGAPGGSEDSLA